MIAFKQPLEDLMAGGPYYFCASIFTSAGTAHGEVMQFEVPGQAKGCGCGAGGSGVSVFALGLVMLAWVSQRRRVATNR